MSKTAWTPGPWHSGAQNDALYVTSGRAPSANNDYPVHDAKRWLVAKVFSGDGGFDAEDANARLIAAAPELYEALELLHSKLVALILDSDGVAGLHLNGDVAAWSDLIDGGVYDDWLGCLDQTKRALAKARGETEHNHELSGY